MIRCGKFITWSLRSRGQHARLFSSEESKRRVLSPGSIPAGSDSLFLEDEYLIREARRSVFTPPPGFTRSDCAERMKELVRLSMVSREDVRVVNILSLANAVLRIGTPSKEWASEVAGFIEKNIKGRRRFSSVFAMMEYLRFLSMTESQPASLEILLNTLNHSRVMKVSECIEMSSLLLKTRAVCLSPDDEAMGIVVCLRGLLENTSDPHSFSTQNRVNALRVSELFFGEFLDSDKNINASVSSALVRLIMSIMKGRNCASPICFERMLRIAFEYKEERSDRASAVELAICIRDTQYSRIHLMKPFLSENPHLWAKLRVLSAYTGVVFGSQDADAIFFGKPGKEHLGKLNVFDGPYTRQKFDLNDRAVFRNGKHWLYFSKASNSWQIGIDPYKELLRLAYFPADSITPPVSLTGWKVFSPKTNSFISSSNTLFSRQLDDTFSPPKKASSKSRCIALATDVSETTVPEDESFEDCKILERWTDVACAPEIESNNDKLRDLEALVASLQEKLDSMAKSCPKPPAKIEKSFTLFDSLTSFAGRVAKVIDSFASGKESMVQVPSLSPRSFESFRSSREALERLDAQRKKIAQQFR